jgi:hypothetical protein
MPRQFYGSCDRSIDSPSLSSYRKGTASRSANDRLGSKISDYLQSFVEI